MPEALKRLLQQFTELWGKLDKSQKTRIIVITAFLIMSLTTAIILVAKPSYGTLISDAESKEIGEISKILDEKKIWNQPVNNGTALKVKNRDMAKAQAVTIQSGYPRSSNMTFDDAFGKIKLNSTESDKKWLKKEYEESKLAQKILLLDNVENASVSLSVPEKSLFVTNEKQLSKPTAVVVVKPKTELNPKQVNGIVMMVSRSVENLDPKDISVVDSNGNVLNDPLLENTETNTSKQFELASIKKKEIENNIRTLFSGQFDNFDSIKVAANVVLDFDTQTVTSVEYKNSEGKENPIARSAESIVEKVTNGSTASAPGTDTNPGTNTVPSYPAGSGQNGSYSKTSTKVNNEIDQTNMERKKALGNMDTERSSITASLLYGANVKEAPAQEVISSVRQAISLASGIPENRVAVLSLKVASIPAVKPTMGEQIREALNTYGFLGVMLLLVFALLFSLVPRRRSGAGSSDGLEEELAFEAAGSNYSNSAIYRTEDQEPLPDIEFEEKSEVKKQIEKFVSQRPEQVAQLLRNWLSDDWE